VETERGFGFVMEFAEKGELRDVLADKAVDLPRMISFKIAIGAARGLEYMHQASMLHKDIKSLNVFVTSDFTARIGDFGLSQIVQKGATTAGRSMRSGAATPAWAAPERSKKRNQFNTKCDVYSFGVVLWEIATRLFPYDGMDLTDIVMSVVQGGRPDTEEDVVGVKISELPDFGAGYDQLVQRCWHQTPEERPEMSQVVTALETLRDSQ